MTSSRNERFGPSWRSPKPQQFEDEQTLVFCCCGVEMKFRWPTGQEDVRCIGCGARFERPEHFPTRTQLVWDRDAPPPRRWIGWFTPPRLIILALSAVAAILLLLGLAIS